MTEIKFTCVFYSWFSVKCQNPRGALSIPGRVGECAQIPGGSGHSWSHRVLGGRRAPRRELGWDTQTQGEVGFSLPEDRREGKRGMNGSAGEGCGRPPGVRGSPQRGGTAFTKPVLFHKQRARAPSIGERTDSSAGRCGAFSLDQSLPGPSLTCGAGLRPRRLSPV